MDLLFWQRLGKSSILLVIDGLLCALALYLALALRLDSWVQPWLYGQPTAYFGSVILTSLLCLMTLHSYATLIKFTNWQFSQTLLWAMTLGIIFAGFLLYFTDHLPIPRSVSVLYVFIATGLLYIARAILKLWFIENSLSYLISGFLWFKTKKPKIIIYGAGEAGVQSLKILENQDKLQVVGFIDDSNKLHRHYIQKVPVYHSDYLEKLVQKNDVSQLLLAIPSLSNKKRKAIISRLLSLQLELKSLPSLEQLTSNTISAQHIRNINIEDLLGREAVEPNPNIMQSCCVKKTVLVTGGGGSVGSEICHQIIQYGASTVVIFDHSEFNLYSVVQKLESFEHRAKVIPCLGSITDKKALSSLFNQYQFDYIYHCAAYKHVPLVEQNPYSGFYNNCVGTVLVALYALCYDVGHFILISTDKAVRPTNLMGVSKRIVELVLQGLRVEQKVPSHPLIPEQFHGKEFNSTHYTAVRFGNVLNSSGSVIPAFRRQLLAGGPLTITHKDVTRYFMTIEEASQLVIQSSSLAEKGWLFLLDMGQPVKIENLARDMVHLAGLQIKDADHPNGQIELKYTGLRQGEKLVEELLIGESAKPSPFEKISICEELGLPLIQTFHLLQEVLDCSRDLALHKLRLQAILQHGAIDYRVPMYSNDKKDDS